MSSSGNLRRIENAVGAGAIATLVLFHALLFRNAGALWRDEVNSVHLAAMPARELWRNLQFDSFPLGWFALLRGFLWLGPGSSDAGLRALGLLLGLATLAALWRNARAFGIGVPLVSLAVLGCNATVLGYGDSVRGYGLGMLTGLATFGLVFDLADRPGPGSLAAALLAALLSVHCLFYNAVFLTAACAGGAAVALRRRQWSTIPRLGVVALLPALSLFIYRGTIRNQSEWNAIVRFPIDGSWIWTKFGEATVSTGIHARWLFVALFALAVGVAIGREVLHPQGPAERRRDASLFCGAALATGTIAYFVFLRTLSYYMQPWYFLTLMALAATCFDGILRPPETSVRLRSVRLVAAVLVMIAAVPGLLAMAQTRKTNLDRIAAAIARVASPRDTVVLTPWHHGIPFARYWRGEAAWLTVPPVASHDIHRYDELKRAMMDPDVMRPVLRRIEDTLRSGGRVFWVGPISAPPEGEGPPVLPPAPEGAWGWREMPHYRGWGMQAGFLLRARALRAEPFPLESPGRISYFENPQVRVFEGWREENR